MDGRPSILNAGLALGHLPDPIHSIRTRCQDQRRIRSRVLIHARSTSAWRIVCSSRAGRRRMRPRPTIRNQRRPPLLLCVDSVRVRRPSLQSRSRTRRKASWPRQPTGRRAGLPRWLLEARRGKAPPRNGPSLRGSRRSRRSGATPHAETTDAPQRLDSSSSNFGKVRPGEIETKRPKGPHRPTTYPRVP